MVHREDEQPAQSDCSSYAQFIDQPQEGIPIPPRSIQSMMKIYRHLIKIAIITLIIISFFLIKVFIENTIFYITSEQSPCDKLIILNIKNPSKSRLIDELEWLINEKESIDRHRKNFPDDSFSGYIFVMEKNRKVKFTFPLSKNNPLNISCHVYNPKRRKNILQYEYLWSPKTHQINIDLALFLTGEDKLLIENLCKNNYSKY